MSCELNSSPPHSTLNTQYSKLLILEPLHAHIHLGHRHAQRALDRVAHIFLHIAGDLADTRAVLDNNIHIDRDLVLAHAHIDAAVRVALVQHLGLPRAERAGDAGLRIVGRRIGRLERTARQFGRARRIGELFVFCVGVGAIGIGGEAVVRDDLEVGLDPLRPHLLRIGKVTAHRAELAAVDRRLEILDLGPEGGEIEGRAAVEELNAKGMEIGGAKVKFELINEDDAADPKQGTAVAQKLCDAKVAGVVGHLNSGTTIPASKIYSDAGIPQISPSATNPKYTRNGYKTAFRVVADDTHLGGTLGRYAIKELKGKSIAVIDDRTAYGQGVAEVFKNTAKTKGMTVVAEEFTTDLFFKTGDVGRMDETGRVTFTVLGEGADYPLRVAVAQRSPAEVYNRVNTLLPAETGKARVRIVLPAADRPSKVRVALLRDGKVLSTREIASAR